MNKKRLKRFILGAVVLTMVIPVGLIYRQYRADISLAYRRVSSGGKIIETACGPIQYTEFGEGPPMLLVHGSGGGYDQGEYFAKLIGGNYRWIAPSRFGFLGMPVPDEANSSLQADAHACLLDALEIDRVGVVGISMGGPSALLFAQQYPQRTKSLAMISAVSHAIPSRSAGLATVFEVFLNDFVYWSMVKATPSALLVALGVPTDVQQELSSSEVGELNAFLEAMVPMGARRSGQLLEQQMSEYEATQIRKIQAPTLVMHAPDDTLVALEQGEFSAREIPGAQFVTMEKGGHLALMLDSSAGERETLRNFLKQYNSR